MPPSAYRPESRGSTALQSKTTRLCDAARRNCLDVDRVPGGDFGGFLHAFAQGRMGVDGGFDFVPGGFEGDGEAELGDHLGRFRCR